MSRPIDRTTNVPLNADIFTGDSSFRFLSGSRRALDTEEDVVWDMSGARSVGEALDSVMSEVDTIAHGDRTS